MAQGQDMGTVVREYDLLESLGAGGMGEVFKARHTLLDAFFAVKVIHKDLTRNPEIRQRFLQEAKFLAKLDHPGIMRLRNVFEEAERLYIVTDYLKGENLARLLSRAGAVPLEDGMDWLYQIAAGVEYAHKSGVVHRDLKPANIMVLDNGTLQILDFGLAKQFDAGVDGVTSPDQFVGTPPYIPPEVLKGDVKLSEIGPEADVYALAVMAYRIFGGCLPYKIDEDESPLRQLSLLIRRHIDRAPIEPLKALRPDLPADFADCIMHVLTVPHVSRPHSAKAFIEMLIRCAATGPLPGGFGEKPRTRELPSPPPPAPPPPAPTGEVRSLHDTIELPSEARGRLLASAPAAAPAPAREEGDAPPEPGKGRGGAVALLAVALIAALVAAWYVYLREPPPPPVAAIVVKVQPDDARISLDGRLVSRSSLHEDRAIAPGRHELLVEKRGHQPYRETLEVAAGASVDRLITLQKAVGTLAVRTQPPGAAVAVDGAKVAGVTPLEVPGLQADVEHAIEATLEGHEAAKATVTVEADERRELSLTLGGGSATLDIETTPDEVGIWLDDEYVGTTPAEIDDLGAGREISVRLGKAGYAGVVQKVTLAAGERRAIKVRLARAEPEDIPVRAQEKAPPQEESRVLVVDAAPQGGSGFVTAEATPAAYLYVDGKFTGRSTPIIGHPVSAGQHTVTLRAPDGREQGYQIVVKPGETVKISKEF